MQSTGQKLNKQTFNHTRMRLKYQPFYIFEAYILQYALYPYPGYLFYEYLSMCINDSICTHKYYVCNVYLWEWGASFEVAKNTYGKYGLRRKYEYVMYIIINQAILYDIKINLKLSLTGSLTAIATPFIISQV